MEKPVEKDTSIVVFDICDTLYYSNTTFDFIHFALAELKKTTELIAFTLLTKKYSPVFLGL